MEQRQIRALRGKGTRQEVSIINIPKKFATFFKDAKGNGIYFNMEKSGNTLIMQSGCKVEITDDQIQNYDYSDCRV